MGIQFTQFKRVLDRPTATFSGAPAFWTVNVHYPLAEAHKMYSNQQLIRRVQRIQDETFFQEKIIMMGDFNSFYPIIVNGTTLEDGHGELQIAELESYFVNVSKHIPFTFTPFPYDSIIARVGQSIDTKLDHVFVTKAVELETWIESCEAVSTKVSRESDHYLMKLVIR